MSKSKSNGVKVAKTEDSSLKKVKDAAVTKPAKTVKAKSQELAKAVVGKEDKKSKKKTKEPTPEPDSESEESDSAESDSSEDESESDEEQAKPVANGKATVNGKAKPAAAAPESDSEGSDSSDESSDSDNETVAKVPAAKKAAPVDSDESDSSDSESEAEKPVKAAATVKAAAKDDASDSDSSDASSDSDSDEEANEKTEAPAASKKRKADDESPFAAKKAKAEAHTDGGAAAGGNGTHLFVGNLSWNVDEEWLSSEFSEFGELSGVRIVTDRDSGRSKGFGYVEFINAADALKAYNTKKDTELDGRKINVDWASGRSNNAGGGADRAQNRAKSFGDKVSPPSDTLFVGNLAFSVDQNTVSDAFGDFGTITGVRLPTDRETGAPKGFGYVTFASIDEAKAAHEGMQGFELAGRTVRLDFSQPRTNDGESPARRGGGGFGGRGGGRGGRGGFGDRGGRGGGRGGFGGRGGARGGRGASTNRGGFGDFSGRKTSFD